MEGDKQQWYKVIYNSLGYVADIAGSYGVFVISFYVHIIIPFYEKLFEL